MTDVEALQRENEELRRRLSEAEQTVRALTSGERLSRAIFDGAPDAMLLADDAGIYVDANPAACELFGVPRAQLVGRSIGEFTGSQLDFVKAWEQFLRQRRMGGQFKLVRPDGSTRELDFLSIANVAPGVHMSVLRDISERRSAEARFMAMIEKSQDGIALSDRFGKTIYMSPAVERVIGRSPSDVEGASAFDYVHPDDRARLAAILADVLKHPSEPVNYEIRVLHADGVIRWLGATATNFLDDPAIGALVTNFRDITERKRAEEVRNRLAAIVESSDDAIISNDLDGVITSWNKGAERLYQWAAAEAVGKHLGVLIPLDHRGDERRLLDRVRNGEWVERYDTTCLRKDGSVVEVALTLSPIRDSAGNIVGASKIARDLTERRKEEATLRRTEEQLRQVQKMDAIGTLAGGVAHDFNNLLSVILGYATLVLEELKPGDPLRADLEEVRRAGERATDLTRQLLAFSRQQIVQPRVLDLSQVVLGMEKMLGRLLGEDVELSLLTSGPVGKVLADPSQIEQIVMNLAANARDAMPRGGKLTIEIENAKFDEAYAMDVDGLSPGPYVMLAISDTGAGMDAATRERIFEPFFTTKEKGKGTGLGLSTVFGIVKQSRGHVWVYSEPGRGTTFKVYLPRTEQPFDTPVSGPPARATRRGSETILLVEDEEQVRLMTRTILRRHGYNIIDAQNAGEAFLICEKNAATIDMLITDVVMPRMSGRELVERLAPMMPGIRVLYVSGYTQRSSVRHGVLDEGIAFLQKPITADALLLKVREVLDATAVALTAGVEREP